MENANACICFLQSKWNIDFKFILRNTFSFNRFEYKLFIQLFIFRFQLLPLKYSNFIFSQKKNIPFLIPYYNPQQVLKTKNLYSTQNKVDKEIRQN